MSRKCRSLIEWFLEGPRRSKQGLTRLSPKSWKSPESVDDRCIGLESVKRVQNIVKPNWHRDPESMRVSRNCKRTVEWIREGRCLCVCVCVCVCLCVCVCVCK